MQNFSFFHCRKVKLHLEFDGYGYYEIQAWYSDDDETSDDYCDGTMQSKPL